VTDRATAEVSSTTSRLEARYLCGLAEAKAEAETGLAKAGASQVS
jgi:hypothetical protein